MFKFIAFSVLVIVSIVNGLSADSRQFSIKDCQKDYSETCLKLDIASFIDKMSERREFKILPQLSLVRDESVSNASESARMIQEMARSFPEDKDKRLDSYIFTKLGNFLQSHTLKIQLMDSQAVAEARSAFSGRQMGCKGCKGGKKGGMNALFMAGMMMKSTLMAVAMGAVALLAGKALMTGMIALVLAAISGLKAMGGEKHTTYEIVAKPMYTSSHSHSTSYENYHPHSSGNSGWSAVDYEPSPYSKP